MLQRYEVKAHKCHAMVYIAADVDDLLARIREAVEAERASRPDCGGYDIDDKPRASLDKLLADGRETVHQCPPDGSGIMPCCGRTPFGVLTDRMATDPALVTCRGKRGAGEG